MHLADTDRAQHYRRIDYPAHTAIVLGNERHGISRPWYEHDFPRVRIPMLGHADSLNMSVSASVPLYQVRAHQSGW